MVFRYDKDKEELVIQEGSRTEHHQLKLWLTRKVKNYRFVPAFKSGYWDGTQTYFRDGKINLGLWKEAYLACKEIQTPFKLENKEDFPINREVTLESVTEFCKEYFKDHKILKKDGSVIDFMPYDHQIQSAYKILKNRFCMAEVATSGGKSLIISIVIFYTLRYINPDAKFLIIVPSITLVTQFYDNIVEYNYGLNRLKEAKEKDIDFSDIDYGCDIKIEEIMSEKPRKYNGSEKANIFIGTYQSLKEWPKDFFKQFHTVVADEAHGAKATTMLKILKSTIGTAYSRFGVSGTFPNEDSCEILTIQSVLGPKITEVTADELKHKGIITPMEIKCVIMNHNDSEYLDKLNYIKRSGHEGKVVYDLEKSYAHNSEKRLKFISKITSKFTENSLILFHTIENGQKIFNTLKEQFPDKDFFYIDGDVSGKKREVIKAEMEVIDNDRPKILVASFGTLAVGVSINAIFNIMFTDSFKSEQVIIQSIGRGLRLHSEKDKVRIFDLVDVFDPYNLSNILYRHFLERKKFYDKRKYPYKIIKVNL